IKVFLIFFFFFFETHPPRVNFFFPPPPPPEKRYFSVVSAVVHPPLPLHGESQINSTLHFILAKESALLNGHIRFIMQPDYPFLYDLLFSIGHQTHRPQQSSGLTIDHILCLDNAETILPESMQDDTISSLKTLLLLFTCPCTYRPYYYYDNISAHFNKLSLMPYLILTSEYAVICSFDRKHGICFHEPNMVSSFHMMFEAQLSSTSPLAKKLPTDTIGPDFVEHFASPAAQPFTMIQSEPLLRVLLEPIHIEKYTAKLPNREQNVSFLLDSLYSSLDFEAIPASFFSTFTEDGVLNFLKTGTVSELPSAFFYPMELDDCLYLIRKMYLLALDKRFFLLKKPLSTLSPSVHIQISPFSLRLLFLDVKGELLSLVIEERRIAGNFFRFSESMQKAGLLATPQESADFLKSVLDNPPIRK
ncbi:hypothetical protein LQZ18_08415, partial [Lachnospiraceae bacterium ZAX-1]